MTTRTYYVPRNQIGRYVINTVVERVGCSIGDITPSLIGVMRFTITCNEKDIPTVERILKNYNLMEGDD